MDLVVDCIESTAKEFAWLCDDWRLDTPLCMRYTNFPSSCFMACTLKRWLISICSQVNGDNTFSLHYDDGDKDKRLAQICWLVVHLWICRIDCSAFSPATHDSAFNQARLAIHLVLTCVDPFCSVPRQNIRKVHDRPVVQNWTPG